MTDKELLTLAAKAAGIELLWTVVGIPVDVPTLFKGMCSDEVWNPLTDDGDALRLAVRLEMTIKITENGAGAYRGEIFRLVALDEATDVEAATRRAITRAAAAIGEDR